MLPSSILGKPLLVLHSVVPWWKQSYNRSFDECNHLAAIGLEVSHPEAAAADWRGDSAYQAFNWQFNSCITQLCNQPSPIHRHKHCLSQIALVECVVGKRVK